MLIQSGTIQAINDMSTPGHEKKVVTLKTTENKDAFIEFRGKLMMAMLEGFEVDDAVQVAIVIDGKQSKSSGVNYNNLVAKTIKKVTN